jgi:hypothetical protein
MARSRGHRFFSHAFLSALDDVSPERDVVAFILTSFYKVVTPFSSARTTLYLRMLESIGVTETLAETLPELPSIGRINSHLCEVEGQRHVAVASAVLACAESTIPPCLPVLAAMTRRTFRQVDTTFFDLPGVRDEGQGDDASTLFVMSADPAQFAAVETAVGLDLDYRSELLGEWLSAISAGKPARRASSNGARKRRCEPSPVARPPHSQTAGDGTARLYSRPKAVALTTARRGPRSESRGCARNETASTKLR